MKGGEKWRKVAFYFVHKIHNFCLDFFFKMAASGHFGSPIGAIDNKVLPLCVINGYAKYEVDR